MAAHPKFRIPVMTRRAGYKNTDHSAASGWLDSVVNAVKAGTAKASHRLAVHYHGQPPHLQDDLSAPIAARPSTIHADPQDVPNSDDQVRRLPPGNVPTHPGTKGAKPGPHVPTKL